MPKGMKTAPPQQSSLQEMWNGKKKEKPAKAEDAPIKAESHSTPSLGMDVDKEETSVDASNGKRKPSPVPKDAPVKLKKRRIIESDDESIGEASEAGPSRPPSSPPPSSPGVEPDVGEPAEPNGAAKRKAKAKAATRRVKVNDEEEDSPNIVKGKSKAKAKAQSKLGKAEGGELKVDEEAAATSANEAVENDEGEEELDLSDEEEAASKNAQSALSRLEEVDLKGGWKDGEPVPYAALAKVFALIEATTKRLEKTSLLTAFLYLVIRRRAQGDTTSLLQSVYLCINRLCPDYVGIELGIGESLLIKAISESTGRSLAVVKADLRQEGDLGTVAQNSKNSQKTLFKPKTLTVANVFKDLKAIAMTAGHESQKKKVQIITKLLAACQGQEAKYIIRSLEGKLRIGNAERTVVVALAHAAVLAEKEEAGKRWSTEKLAQHLEEGANIIKAVYSELPTYDRVVPALLEGGIDGLRARCKLEPGVPLKPMLAKPTKAIGEVLDRFEGKRFTCEYKYDGERAQVHRLPDGTIAVFSRNSEDMTKKYPEFVEQIPRCIKEGTESFVLDCEAVAIDKGTGTLMPFQELSKRKRKDVKIEDIQIRVCLFAFDLIYLNGESLLQKPLVERRELLRAHFQTVDKEFQFAKSSDGETSDEIQQFLEESVKDGCEGLMVKMLETDASHYEPSRRSVNWLKIKKDYLAGVGDSLDLVVVGAYHGKGKRTAVYGAFLLACYDADSEAYQTICKIGTGFSEEALAAHYATLHPLETAQPRGDIRAGGAKPNVWLEPKVVWEVKTADLSLSPIYEAARGLVDERGISLRFPRFIRIRDDKDAEDATGPEQIAEMYESQALAAGSKKKKGGEGDDGFW